MNTREIIFNTAKRLYLENGFASTPNKLIAKEAGVNLGLITYYFKTKDSIASDMLNFNYQTLYSHVIKYLDPDDELMQILTFFKLHFTLTDIDADYDHFIYEMNQLDLLEKATRDGELFVLFKKLVGKKTDILEQEKDRFCDLAVSMLFSVMRGLTIKQHEEEIVLSKEELYELCLGQMFYALKIETNPVIMQTLMSAATATVARLLEEFPELKQVKNYLYIEI